MMLLFVILVVSIDMTTGLDILFMNNLNQNIELVMTPNNRPMRTLAILKRGQSHRVNIPRKWAGNFRHTHTKRDGTLFEISNRVNDNNICYDLSVVHDIFNVPMKVKSPDGRMLKCTHRKCPDAYLFPADNSKNHCFNGDGRFIVTFGS